MIEAIMMEEGAAPEAVASLARPPSSDGLQQLFDQAITHHSIVPDTQTARAQAVAPQIRHAPGFCDSWLPVSPLSADKWESLFETSSEHAPIEALQPQGEPYGELTASEHQRLRQELYYASIGWVTIRSSLFAHHYSLITIRSSLLL